MRICYLSAPNSCIVREWAQFFTKKGHEVILLSELYEPVPGVEVRVTKPPYHIPAYSFAMQIARTRLALTELQPDVVLGHYVYGYGFIGALCRYHPLALISMGNDIGIGPERSKVVRMGSKYALKKADVVSVKDSFARERAIELGCDPSKIVIHHSCCDTKRFCPTARDKVLRTQFTLNGGKTVLFVRPINSEYRAETLWDAIPKVVQAVPDVRFVLVYRGQDRQKWLVNSMKAGWMKNIFWLPYIPHDEMHNYLASVDLMVDTFYPKFPVGGHGHGTNLVETMACGTPQILPDRPEYLESWCKAELFRKGDSDDLADKIIHLLDDDTRRREMSFESRKSAVEFGDKNQVMGDMLGILEGLAR